jgi:hypothetical protein
MMNRVTNKIMLDMVNKKRVDIKEMIHQKKIIIGKVTINKVVLTNKNSEVPNKLIGEENKERLVGFKKE